MPPRRSDGKSKEQVEFLTSHLANFFIHQTAGSLDRFWPRVYEGWQKQWPIVPPAEDIKVHGSREKALSKLRAANNKNLRTWFHNKGRPTSKSSKSDLRLGQTEKRKLAPAQAYCNYNWESGLKDVVEARWDQHLKSQPTPTSAAQIPIDFKLKISKELYDALPPDERKQVEERRDAEWAKLYRPVRDIVDPQERDEKLTWHEHNQPTVAKTLSRALKNLEDQAGCIAHLLVGYVNPRDGTATFQNYSQGEGEFLDFRHFCGDDWNDVIEKRFTEWGMEIFGKPNTSGRSQFMFTNAPPVPQPTASSSTTRDSATPMEEYSEASPSPSINAVDDVEGVGIADVIALDEHAEDARAVPQEISATQQTPGPIEFISPQEIFGIPMSIEFTADNISTTSPVAVQLPSIAPSPLDFPRVTTPHQTTIAPVVSGPLLVTPLEPSQAVVSPLASEITDLVSSSDALGSPHQAKNHSVVDKLSGTHDLPQAPQVVGPHPAEGATNGMSGTTRSTYKTRVWTEGALAIQSRRDSVEGAPDVILTLGGSGYELPGRPYDSPLSTASSATSHHLKQTTTPFDNLIVPSSQQSLEGVLTIPVEINTTLSSISGEPAIPPQEEHLEASSPVVRKLSLFTPRIIPTYHIDRSDIPSWLIDRGRLDFILSVEAGGLWEKLIMTWLRQERRLGFGLDEKIGVNLNSTQKPKILGEYFKWHHNPSKGDSVVLPEFGEEVALWWYSIQPQWRPKSKTHDSDYSYILAGGKKGVFLLILCLAWWDRAWAQKLEGEKPERHVAARAATKDDANLDPRSLPAHDCAWFNILCDLIYVLERAQGWPVPAKGGPATTGARSGRTKRAAEPANASPRKKKRSS
ncbi:hypothetical protein BJ322DRAFT_1025103 [Thelephora terrestris]|uniref:Uncharacterized protein n=1 Tax=Thelephora terrestris TaxID=56493 RepID=A0A9P6H3Y1_9AGAM|nr:hypothetical protein BJ322DRAFT_1025103 [Thelephora terrestris]